MQFVKEFRECKTKILCNIVLNIASWPFKGFNARLRKILALVLLFFLFEIIELAALLIIQRPIPPVFIASLAAALTASLAIYVVSWCYQYTLGQMEAAIGPSTLGKNTEKGLVDWLRAVVNPWSQVLTSVVLTILGLVALYVIDKRFGLPFDLRDGVTLVPLINFWGGQGIYWAFVTPFITERLKQGDVLDLEVYWLYPSRTPILAAMSRVLSVFAVWVAVMITLCLVVLFALSAALNTNGILYPLSLLLGGYAVSAWTFLYPQLNLARIVHQAKENTLLDIVCEIEKICAGLDKLRKADFERLGELMKLYETVNKSPNTVINLSALRSFIGSLAAPTITTVAGLLDWDTILQKLL